MKVNRSTSKEDYCFAVHPLSVQMNRQFSHYYVLYFEKDLHIFGRYELTEKELGSQEKYYYQLPNSIQTFTVLSGEELEFKWSLYMERTLDNYHHEQYMESKKANLKWCWDVLKTHQKNTHCLEAIFGMAKIKFNYIFVLATSQEQVFKELQLYYKENNITPTKIKQLLRGSPSKLSKYIKEQPESEINGSNLTPVNRISGVQWANQSGIKLSSPPGISGIRDSKYYYSNLQLQKNESEKSSPYSPNKLRAKLKHSISQLEAIKQIQNCSKEYQDRFLKSQTIPFESTTPIISGVNYLSESKFQEEKKITSSQYIDYKGEVVITPFYLQLKYWFVIFAILFIFVWLIGQGPKHMRKKKSKMPLSHHHKHSEKNKHNNDKKIKKQQEEKSQRRRDGENTSKKGRKR